MDPGHFIAGGNFFDVIPYEGRYDAQPLAIFQSRRDQLQQVEQPLLSGIAGQVRDLQWLKHRNGSQLLVVARNNEPLLFFKK